MKKAVSLFLVLIMWACKFVTSPFDNPTFESQITPEVSTSMQASLSPTAQDNQISVGYVRNCLRIDKRESKDVVLQGRIATMANDSYKLVFFPPPETFPNELEDISGESILGISRDGQWLVYELADAPEDFISITGFSWITDTRWTTEVFTIPRDKSYWAYWLDDERLLFNFYLDNPIVANMFTGEEEQVIVKYPGFHLDESHASLLSRDLSRMVAYRSIPEEPPSIVLWDLASKNELWRIYISQESILRNLAQVSPDGEQIVVSGSLEYFVDPFFYDLFLLDWDGKAKQLTNLRVSGLSTSLAEQLRWSPDGRYLAFWLNESLAVYDTTTRLVSDYCIRSSDSMSFAPHWSPNSQQIAFNGDAPPPGSGPIIIVDVINDSAAKITENGYYVEGWMSDTR